jgi:hypothetical protein
MSNSDAKKRGNAKYRKKVVRLTNADVSPLQRDRILEIKAFLMPKSEAEMLLTALELYFLHKTENVTCCIGD